MRTNQKLTQKLFALALFIYPALALAQVNIGLPIIELKAGIYRIQAELADTPKAREVGLMNRTSMPTNSGMLFVFEQKAGHCFWMHNTKIPLSIAFIADDGRIVNIEEMQAKTTNNHCPKAAIRFALEMNKQWFPDRVIVPGSVISGLPKKQVYWSKSALSRPLSYPQPPAQFL
ncbi:DUF192 domain-containing protein [Polynucleobacter necessarius]|uniref:DUF192 domain-containing protein n=1 Tax=Polynucleobacter necessarius TaxID=576610 RepID=UPI000E09ACC7|nr:DUF192 domain-containing protein [Polynucleobacter necessarius]HAT39728.1 hypothetical protein [Polynucleobacter sp.]